MRFSAHLLATAWAAGLTTAAVSPPQECWNSDLSLNATNVETLANCTLYTYACIGADDGITYAPTTYSPTTPPANCMKTKYNVYFSDYNMTGPVVVPRMVEMKQFSFEGFYPWYINNSSAIEERARYLRVDSIDFPDLVNITDSGMQIKYAHNVSSLKFPKLENVYRVINLDLSGGPAISLSFPSLRVVGAILIQGKIDALSFPALNQSSTINITSTGDLDCVAFAATVVNTTTWPTHYQEVPESFSCTSKKNSIKTHPVTAEDTSGSSGVSGFRENLLLLAVLVGSASLVI